MNSDSNNAAQNLGVPSARSQATSKSNAAPAFAVGDPVTFLDEWGMPKKSFVTAVDPIGEYSATELGYAIRGSYGDYVRVAADIKPLAVEQQGSLRP